MNKKIYLIALALLGTFTFNACDNDDPIAKPEVSILELGSGHNHGNDHVGHVGEDLHIEAEIIADGKISEVQLLIHPEGEHHKSGLDGDEWELDTVYTKFSGLKNTTFHEHVEIADWAEPGDYHFDLIVTDMEGNQSSAEAELEIIEE